MGLGYCQGDRKVRRPLSEPTPSGTTFRKKFLFRIKRKPVDKEVGRFFGERWIYKSVKTVRSSGM